ncbi:MAG: 4Fe-4S binding protein [Dehalogenimonas sp.]
MKRYFSVGRLIFSLAVLSLLAAFFIGRLPKTNDVQSYLPGVFHDSSSFGLKSFQAPNDYLFEALDSVGNKIGLVTVSQGNGYGGPMTVVMGWTLDGKVISISVPKHNEDKAWWDQLSKYDYFSQYVGRKFDNALTLGQDINAVTGSTVSSNGVSIGVHQARALVANYFGAPYVAPKQTIKFGLPELLVVLGLLLVVLFRTVPPLRTFKWGRALILFLGFAVLGVWLARPLSITNIATWLLGSPPALATSIVLYILVFGVIGMALVSGKNFYCYWLCPFAAVQEVTNKVGRVRLKPTPEWHKRLQYVRYLLLWVVLMLTLIFMNPSLATFEPWGTLFSQLGTYDQWLLLILTLAFSFVVFNVWCNYACPVGAFMDMVLKIRKGALQLWQKISPLSKKEKASEEI